MLHFYTGTDREKARTAMKKAADAVTTKGVRQVRITDANTPADLASTLQGGGMFAEERVIILEGIVGNEDMRTLFFDAIDYVRKSPEQYFLFEEKLDAVTRKQVEKYAESSEKFDAVKKTEAATTIFALANALRNGDKKALWVAYTRESLTSAPEAIHGVLFWGAKDMYLKARGESERARAQKLIARLAELPHESRRGGYELGYALESFVLSGL